MVNAVIGAILAVLALFILVKVVGLIFKLVAILILVGAMVFLYLWLQNRIDAGRR